MVIFPTALIITVRTATPTFFPTAKVLIYLSEWSDSYASDCERYDHYMWETCRQHGHGFGKPALPIQEIVRYLLRCLCVLNSADTTSCCEVRQNLWLHVLSGVGTRMSAPNGTFRKSSEARIWPQNSRRRAASATARTAT
jgi:hypothetical protein